MAASVLQVSDLTVEFSSGETTVRAVDGLSLSLGPGESLGLVGESGSGKSTVALAILGLVPEPPGRVCGGVVLFHGEDLLAISPAQLREVRGARIAMVFQDPASALNPVLRIGEQVAEVMRVHQGLDRARAKAHAVAALDRVGIPAPESRYRAYPHELSGGTRQRVLLAMALACEPEVLLADEPTTSVDVTLQAQLLDLLRGTQRRAGMSMIFISHDLAVVSSICQRVLVLLAGREVECGPVRELFSSPRHPYTAHLVRSARALSGPAGELDPATAASKLVDTGCPFAPVCPEVDDRCRAEMPPLTEAGPGRRVRCFRPLEEEREDQGTPTGDQSS